MIHHFLANTIRQTSKQVITSLDIINAYEMRAKFSQKNTTSAQAIDMAPKGMQWNGIKNVCNHLS
jgi:hypothetical protein